MSLDEIIPSAYPKSAERQKNRAGSLPLEPQGDSVKLIFCPFNLRGKRLDQMEHPVYLERIGWQDRRKTEVVPGRTRMKKKKKKIPKVKASFLPSFPGLLTLRHLST